jgi:hypothetical protein
MYDSENHQFMTELKMLWVPKTKWNTIIVLGTAKTTDRKRLEGQRKTLSPTTFLSR